MEEGQDAMPGRGIVYMDREKAPLIIMGVEQRQGLVAMRGIGRIVDVQGNGARRALMAPAPQIHQSVGHPDRGEGYRDRSRPHTRMRWRRPAPA